MTHYTIGVLLPPRIKAITSFAKKQMRPYKEHRKVPPYVCYSVAQAEQDRQDSIHRFRRIIQRQDPAFDIEACHAEVQSLLSTTAEEMYREWIARHERFNSKGEPISTNNPNGKWDWYCIGGRWDGWFCGRSDSGGLIENNLAPIQELVNRNLVPHAIITPEGQWHERGKMGWFGTLLTENEHWDCIARDLLLTHWNHQVLLLDAHI
jgi:hypothetical protein